MALGGASVVVIDIAARFLDQTSPGIDTVAKKVDKFDQSVKKTQDQIKKLDGTKANPTLGIKDKATEIVNKVTGTLKNLAGKTFNFTAKLIDYATKPLRGILNFATSIQGVITGIFAGLAAKKIVMQPIELADSITSAEIGFETLFKSADKAKKMMDDINQFAKETPFKTAGVIAQTQKMIAMGWNADEIIKDLRTIGDAAAGTGKGDEGLASITYALSEIKSKGKLSTQELNQLASAGIKAKSYIAQGLGYGTDDAGLQKSAKAIESGLVGADQAIGYIMEGMKEFEGLMDKTANKTVNGLKSQIEDAFEISIISKWGRGLQRGAIAGLGKVVDLLNNSEKGMENFGKMVEDFAYKLSSKAATALGNVIDKIQTVTNTDAFKNADMGGKIKILWGEVIAKPFDEWWSSKGQKWLADKALNIGKGIGGTIKGGLLALIGVDASGAVEDGLSIGANFAQGFIDGFDAGKVISATLGKVVQSTDKTLSGKGSTGDLLITALAAYGLFKGGKGVKNLLFGKSGASKGLVGGAKSTWNWGKNLFTGGKAAVTVADTAVDAVTDVAQATAKSVPILDQYGNAIKTVTKTTDVLGDTAKVVKGVDAVADSAKAATTAAKGLSKLKGIPVLGTLLTLGVSSAVIATAPKEERGKETAGEIGSIAGGLAGAKIGALTAGALGTALGSVAPGVGNAIGGAVGVTVGGIVGGIGGAIGGESFLEWLYSIQDPVFKWCEDTGKTIGDFFTKTLPGFFTQTIPNAAGAAWGAISDFGTYIGKKIGDFFKKTGESTGNFFTKTLPDFFIQKLPYAIGYAVGSIESFFTGTLPNAWDDLWTSVGNFFTQSIPNWWNGVITSVGDWWNGTMVPGWNNFWSSIGNFFTETIPTWATGVWNTASNFFTQTVPAFFSNLWNSVYGFFTGTLPTWATNAFNASVGFFTETIPGFFTSLWKNVSDFVVIEIPKYAQQLKDSITGWFGNFKDWASDIWEKVKSSFGVGRKDAKENGGTATINAKPNANGSIIDRPTVALMGEAGPEAIIPLSGQRRERGISLWEKAGQMLGVRAYADGGIVGNTRKAINTAEITRGTGGIIMPISLGGVEFNIQLPSGGDAQDILTAVKVKAAEIANILGLEMANKLVKIFANLSLEAEGVK